MAKKILDVNEKVYIVPKYLISRIIGQKGKQIQEIIDNSKISKVRFPNDQESGEILERRGIQESSAWEKAVIIFIGCQSSLERAEMLMDYLVASLEETDQFSEEPKNRAIQRQKKQGQRENSEFKLKIIQEKNQLVTSGYSTDSSITSNSKRRRGCRGGRKHRRKNSSSFSDNGLSGFSESDTGIYSELSISDMESTDAQKSSPRKSLESLAEINSVLSPDEYELQLEEELLSPDEPATPESGSISLEGSDLTALSDFDSLENMDMDWADDDVHGGTPVYSEGEPIFEYPETKAYPEPISYRKALVKNLDIDERLRNLQSEIKEETKKRMRGTRGGKKMRKRNSKKKNSSD
ncbi:Oidioi.mRNA.OKI2018_I69.chr1.g1098.t1.cds [Oikopleura dioica]|uniref:Oidioi.mRNA.OKI2018_I69.chr1.g1098.t1.cds n=1 Tax=Oikopleura dioica TaxID=34765 RepID=A0ABN7SS28_OIKDI|nr:Oidioi.mRNA.OKI2018_I69.chr1.g1098.t1.cds [Oikopleura dioica]